MHEDQGFLVEYPRLFAQKKKVLVDSIIVLLHTGTLHSGALPFSALLCSRLDRLEDYSLVKSLPFYAAIREVEVVRCLSCRPDKNILFS
jgi:hypothetical protein